MRKFYNAICIVSLGVFGLAQTGCTPSSTDTKTTPTANSTEAEKGHDHADHDHGDHRHGTHSGEIVVTEPGHIDVEWTHNHDDGEVTIYVDGKTVQSAYINLEVTGKDAKKYDLAAGTEPNSFTIKDTELVTAIDASEADPKTIKPTVVIVVDGAEHKADLKVFHH
jgi:hypothetical protein